VRDAVIVVDESIRNGANFVAGANKPGYHLRNVNLGRDYEASIVGDIAAAEAGMLCPVCGTPMTAERAIEIGNIFKLGSFYSQTMGAMYLDPEGQARPIVMGSYGIGSGRAAAIPCHAAQPGYERGCGHSGGSRAPVSGADRCRHRGPLRRPVGPRRRQVQRRGPDRQPDSPFGQHAHARQRPSRNEGAQGVRGHLHPAG
jgi:hypothetical protein